MKLQRLELQNFASFYGKNEPISLKVSKEKPLIIFVGETGFGKTSLFDAINWALYGGEYETNLFDNKERKIEDYANEVALREALNADDRMEMRATLFFEHQGETRGRVSVREYYITQVLVIKPQKHQNEIIPKIIDRQTHLREILASGDHQEIPYTKTFLDEILPNNVKSYFLFDGDRIHNLAKPGNSQEVKDAIYRVVDLEIIKNAAEHLNDAALEFNKKAAKAATGKLAEVEEAYNEELKYQTTLKRRINDIKNERQAIKDQIATIDQKLSDQPESSSLQERKNALVKDLAENEKTQKELKNQMREKAATAGLYFSADAITDLKELLHEKRVRGEIPKHVRETFFQDLFALGECICGTKFEKEAHDKVYQTLMERLETEKSRSNEEDRLVDLLHELNLANLQIEDARTELQHLDDQIIDLEEVYKSLVFQKQEIDKQLEDIPVEDIATLWSERRKRDDRDKELLVENETNSGLLVQSVEKLKKLTDDRTDLTKKQKEAQTHHLRGDLAKKAADELSNKFESFAEQSRKDVEELTINEFRQFVTSSSGYKVALGSDYSLEVLDSNGNRALQRLSMGQSQCLSLAFITAISRVSKKNPPLVIDMPFGRLDPNVHAAISKRLPELSAQTILFLIPGVEWNNTTISNLSNYATQIYEMTFDKRERRTSLTATK